MHEPTLHTNASARELLSESQTAQFLGVSIGALRKWRNQGSGPRFAKIGRLIRYRVGHLNEWVDSHTLPKTPDSRPGMPQQDVARPPRGVSERGIVMADASHLTPRQARILEAAKEQGVLVSRGFNPPEALAAYRSWCCGQRRIFTTVTLWPVYATIHLNLDPAGRQMTDETLDKILQLLRLTAGRRWCCEGGWPLIHVTRVPVALGVGLGHLLMAIAEQGSEPVPSSPYAALREPPGPHRDDLA